MDKIWLQYCITVSKALERSIKSANRQLAVADTLPTDTFQHLPQVNIEKCNYFSGISPRSTCWCNRSVVFVVTWYGDGCYDRQVYVLDVTWRGPFLTLNRLSLPHKAPVVVTGLTIERWLLVASCVVKHRRQYMHIGIL